MYSFAVQNAIGKYLETAFEDALTEASIPFSRNPYTGTDNPHRADYDHVLHIGNGLLIEEKANPAADSTGNIAVETDILTVSKAHYFLIAYITKGAWGAQVIDRHDIYTLLNSTVSTINGRTHKYKRVAAGQYGSMRQTNRILEGICTAV